MRLFIIRRTTKTPLRSVRIWLAVFIVGLVLSGVTAFPLVHELHWLVAVLHAPPLNHLAPSAALLPWILSIDQALTATNAQYPFLAYGTDWLAFAHLVIAVAFVGPWIDPVRNKWIITFGLIACAGVLPLALLAGQVRGIPVGWRLIDCSFGLIGAIPLFIVRKQIGEMEREARSMPSEPSRPLI